MTSYSSHEYRIAKQGGQKQVTQTDPKSTLPYQVTLAAPLPYRASANGAEPSVPSFPPLH
jgi:hypothetical protein